MFRDKSDLLKKSHKTLIHCKLQNIAEKMKEDQKKWRDIPYFWVRRLNVVKMLIVPKLFYRFNAIPIKNLKKIVLRK